MDEMKGRHIINQLRSKWLLTTLLGNVLLSAGLAFLLAVILHEWWGWTLLWGILFAAAVCMILLLWQRPWLMKNEDMARWLNQTYPQLEESCGLLLREPGSLNFLERLQYGRTNNALLGIEVPLPLLKKLGRAAAVAAIMAVAGILVYQFPSAKNSNSEQHSVSAPAVKEEKLLPQVASINVTITPPLYTAKPARRQQAFNLLAEEASVVDWQLQTNTAAHTVAFIFNDKMKTVLQPVDAARTRWRFTRKIDTTGFYQVSIDGILSEFYTIETIIDKAPVIHLLSPKQYTTIEYGDAPLVKLNTQISDDYAVKDAFIAATIASGSGEAVTFKEQKIVMHGFTPGKSQYQLQQVLSLTGLGMQAGDELYFYVQATDNHQQQTRSDIYIVHLPDTAQLMSLDGLANTLTLKPEYFRSQRQIIIETEQLLKDRDTLSAEEFKNRSNNLGIDQKLLRLRYGKFLGDEEESGEEGAGALGDIADFSNADKVRDAFTDKHDNAEDATFYEPETKKQLRATLTEMWNAELRLRTFVPKEALPFEYKALRLLKDLQQQSRAYVAKTNFKTTPLDLKKRLTGDISKIDPPVVQKNILQQPDLLQAVRNALAVLEDITTTGDASAMEMETLRQASLRLQEQATRQPAVYLAAVAAMKKIVASLTTNKNIDAQDVLVAQNGLQKMLDAPALFPSAVKGPAKQALSKQYFDNLQNRHP